jgi:ubiquinone biosynthesis protein
MARRSRRSRARPREAAAGLALLAGLAGGTRAAPRLSALALRHGLLPSLPAALGTWRREGRDALHWKVLGDGLARFLQQSGPVYTKLGQVLATREDWLPPALCIRLEKLYSEQPAMPQRELRRALAAAFPDALPFAALDPTPIGVGSIGQVHRATLPDGRRAVVKLLRPGVADGIRRDVDDLRGILCLGLAPTRTGRAALPRALDALAALERGLLAECDLEAEARAYREFGARLAGNPEVRVPECYSAWSSPRALVLEELVGVPLAKLRERPGDDATRRRAALLALREILSQVFEDGRFHADPHGGNLLWLDDGRLGLIDLGTVGTLDRAARGEIARAVRAFLARDADGVLSALLGLGQVSDAFDYAAFKSEVAALFAARGGRALARLRGRRTAAAGPAEGLEELVEKLFGLARRHGVRFPDQTVLLVKTLVTLEGLVRSLDPELDVVLRSLPVVLASLAPAWLRWPRRRSRARFADAR